MSDIHFLVKCMDNFINVIYFDSCIITKCNMFICNMSYIK